jgi:hypothetical protein
MLLCQRIDRSGHPHRIEKEHPRLALGLDYEIVHGSSGYRSAAVLSRNILESRSLRSTGVAGTCRSKPRLRRSDGITKL